MARSVRDHRLETRAARARLGQQAEPYWTLLSEGFHLGYYRGKNVAKWVVRHRPPGRAGGYTKATLGEADDTSDADGTRILDYRQAQDKAREWLRSVEGGVAIVANYTVGDALDEYLKAYTKKDFVNTRRRIETIIKPALGSIKLSRLQPIQLRNFLNERASSPARIRTRKGEPQKFRPLTTPEEHRRRRASANRELVIVKAALNLALANGRIGNDNGWKSVKKFKGADGARLRYLSDDEARRLVNATAPDFRAIVQAALLTGGRWGELRAIRVCDVDLSSGTVRFMETKNGHSRISYLEKEGVALFKRQIVGKAHKDLVFPAPNGERWNDSVQSRRMEAACDAGNVDPRATFHDLRRTYGARLAIQGTPMSVIAQALGHADERITIRHYAHLAPSYVASTVRQNASGMGIVMQDNVVSLVKQR